jgi:quercetin dioxygenase-like cupin family protein
VSRRRRPKLAIVLALIVAFALGAVLPGAFGETNAEPTAIRTALAESDHVEGAAGRTMVLSRVVIQPGAKLALHHHLGTQISRVTAGTLTYTVERGSAVVHEGESGVDERLVRKIGAGETARIRPGQWLIEQPSDIHRAANHGSTPVVIYLATLLEGGAAPSTPVPQPVEK